MIDPRSDRLKKALQRFEAARVQLRTAISRCVPKSGSSVGTRVDRRLVDLPSADREYMAAIESLVALAGNDLRMPDGVCRISRGGQFICVDSIGQNRLHLAPENFDRLFGDALVDCVRELLARKSRHVGRNVRAGSSVYTSHHAKGVSSAVPRRTIASVSRAASAGTPRVNVDRHHRNKAVRPGMDESAHKRKESPYGHPCCRHMIWSTIEFWEEHLQSRHRLVPRRGRCPFCVTGKEGTIEAPLEYDIQGLWGHVRDCHQTTQPPLHIVNEYRARDVRACREFLQAIQNDKVPAAASEPDDSAMQEVMSQSSGTIVSGQSAEGWKHSTEPRRAFSWNYRETPSSSHEQIRVVTSGQSNGVALDSVMACVPLVSDDDHLTTIGQLSARFEGYCARVEPNRDSLIEIARTILTYSQLGPDRLQVVVVARRAGEMMRKMIQRMFVRMEVDVEGLQRMRADNGWRGLFRETIIGWEIQELLWGCSPTPRASEMVARLQTFRNIVHRLLLDHQWTHCWVAKCKREFWREDASRCAKCEGNFCPGCGECLCNYKHWRQRSS